jgi:hypothetical protein
VISINADMTHFEATSEIMHITSHKEGGGGLQYCCIAVLAGCIASVRFEAHSAARASLELLDSFEAPRARVSP